MTSLRDELLADQDPRSQCRVCTWLETLPKKDQADWDEVCADRSFTHASIHRAMTKRQVTFGRGSVESHRANRHRQ